MEPIIEDYFDQVKIGRKQTFKNMAVFPCGGPGALDNFSM